MKTTLKTTKKTAIHETDGKPQIDKFKDLARELETNEDEAAFDRALKKVAKVAKKRETKPKNN